MNLMQIIILGAIQGLTEFLPVSSSGHLAFLQQLMNFSKPPLTLDILLHFATLLAVIVFFWKRLWSLITDTFSALIKFDLKAVPNMVWSLIIGTFPAVIIGLFLKDFLETAFSSHLGVGLGFLITSLSLFSLQKLKTLEKSEKIDNKKALLIGSAQAIAIMPGVSRSGSTIVSARWLKVSPRDAFDFSFLLSIPAILGATVLDIPNMQGLNSMQILNYGLGMLVASIVGFIALRLLKNLVIKDKLHYFAWYTLVMAMLTIFLLK